MTTCQRLSQQVSPPCQGGVITHPPPFATTATPGGNPFKSGKNRLVPPDQTE